MVVPFKLAPVAVNVTLVPAQIVVDGEVAIETVGVAAALTVTVITFEFAAVQTPLVTTAR